LVIAIYRQKLAVSPGKSYGVSGLACRGYNPATIGVESERGGHGRFTQIGGATGVMLDEWRSATRRCKDEDSDDHCRPECRNKRGRAWMIENRSLLRTSDENFRGIAHTDDGLHERQYAAGKTE
jgi:hypothetical protein